MHLKPSYTILYFMSLIISSIVLIQVIDKILKNVSYDEQPTVITKETDIKMEDEFKICQSLGRSHGQYDYLNHSRSLKELYIITPTFRRSEQVAELTRLFQTLQQVSNLHWILAEDAPTGDCSIFLLKLLLKFYNKIDKNKSMKIVHIASKPPSSVEKKRRLKTQRFPRGVSGRRSALKWLYNNTRPVDEAVIYFADDDNTYSLDLFPEIRKTKYLSMFPVGLIRPFGVSSPIVSGKTGKIVGFIGTSVRNFEKKKARMFQGIDMAGFAVSLKLLHSKRPNMPYEATMEEEKFLDSINIRLSEVEPLANNCTQILVWHTQTYSQRFKDYPYINVYEDTNIRKLLQQNTM